MNQRVFAACCLFLFHSSFSFALSSSSNTQLTNDNLNGLSVYEELRRQYFVTELYSVAPAKTVGELQALGGEVQVEIKFLRNMSANKFSQLWVRGAVINNQESLLNQEKSNLDLFANTFEGQFKAGDSLVMHCDANGQVSIYLNKRLLGQIPSSDFIYVLLNGVVGDVPLSSSFKRALLAAGEIDEQLRSNLQQLQLNSNQGELSIAQN